MFSIVQVVGGLVDDVHQDGGQVGDGEDGGKVSAQLHLNHNVSSSRLADPDSLHSVLSDLGNPSVVDADIERQLSPLSLQFLSWTPGWLDINKVGRRASVVSYDIADLNVKWIHGNIFKLTDEFCVILRL